MLALSVIVNTACCLSALGLYYVLYRIDRGIYVSLFILILSLYSQLLLTQILYKNAITRIHANR